MSENIQIRNIIEKEIEKAVEFCQKEYSRDNIWEILKINSEDNPEINTEKQICILKLNTILSQKEADLLVFHQTNHHGLIREACAQKINEFMKQPKYVDYFQSKYILDTLLKAINDINPNICRLIIEVLPNIKNKDYFLNGLYERFEFVFAELENLKRSNWYTKKLFNLYWCLESLRALGISADARMEDVLKRSANFKDYTIREKTAMVLYYLDKTTPILNEIKILLKNDENYYVRRYSSQW